MKAKLFILLFVFLNSFAFGQNRIPKISGTAIFSVEKGTIECDITLSEYSHIPNYLIRLNKGFNILNIESLEPNNFLLGFDRDLVESHQTDETVSYYFPADVRGEKYLPSKLRFRYVGKFPVINDTISNLYQRHDWRGNIAFMNGLLRMDGLQSGWYPTLYNVDEDFQYDQVKYDIQIICKDCEQLYMNGSRPVIGKVANFKSDAPKEPLLFIGTYSIQEGENMTLLNADFSPSQVEQFDSLNYKIVSFLQDFTGLPCVQKTCWIQSYMTFDEVGYFAYASSPAYVVCGNPPYDLKATFNEQINAGFSHTIAHELSHYYFGLLNKSSNSLECLLNEGFAEYMAMKYDESIGRGPLSSGEPIDVLAYFEDFKFKPILEFNQTSDTDDRETYGYDYQSMVLVCIEKEIGVESMKKWFHLLLTEGGSFADKTYFKSTLKRAIDDDKKYNEVIEKYLTGNSTLENMHELFNQ